MIVSLNEIEGLALKAARGAGFEWGLAEEIAWAARSLASYDLDVIAALEDMLVQPWHRRDSRGCPIRLGCHVADAWPAPLPGTVPFIGWPIWLIPFIGAVVAQSGGPAGIFWGATRIILTPDPPAGVRLHVEGFLLDRCVDPIQIVPVAASPANAGRLPHRGERQVKPAAWHRLEQLGTKTYVPASQQSREAGAGAGLSDND